MTARRSAVCATAALRGRQEARADEALTKLAEGESVPRLVQQEVLTRSMAMATFNTGPTMKLGEMTIRLTGSETSAGWCAPNFYERVHVSAVQMQRWSHGT